MLPLKHRTVAHLLDRAVSEGAARTFLLFNDETYTYGEALLQIDRMVTVLSNRGVKEGSHVALMLKNCPEYVWALLAIGRLGAIGIPLNTEAKGRLLRYYCSDSQAEYIMIDRQFVAEAEGALEGSGLHTAWVMGGIEEGLSSARETLDLEDEIQNAGGTTPPITSARNLYRRPFLFMYTSGTTGPSKAVVVSHAHAITTGLVVADTFQLTAEDRMYTCLPLFHVNAICYTTLAAMYCHASVALAERFSASRFWDDVVRYGATEVNAMGSMFNILEKQPISEAEGQNSLRVAFVVPFPTDPYAFEERYGAKLTSTYALSEWIPVALSSPGEGYEKAGVGEGSFAGPILPYSEVRIVDDDDEEVPEGETGEIVLRAREPWVTLKEYYGKAEATVEAFRNLWFHTGDFGYKDDDGYLYFVGRKKDAIRRRGENISAYELEEIMRGHERIREVAAIPIPSELGEDDVAIIVVQQDDQHLSEPEIIEYAQSHLPRYMVPRYIRIVDELPKTATSKVEKYKLVEQARESLHEMWDATQMRLRAF